MVIGSLTEYIENDQPGKDKTGLSRWSVMTFKGDIDRMQVICRYTHYNKSLDSSTTYQQHCGFFITKKKDLTCPQTKFREDLVSQLQKWREEGDHLIICLDANEDVYKKY
jgi:hypothetical protein